MIRERMSHLGVSIAQYVNLTSSKVFKLYHHSQYGY